jgi:competence protein ComEC
VSIDLRLGLPAVACWLVCGVLVALPGQAFAAMLMLWAAALVSAVTLFLLRARIRVARVVGVLCVSLAAASLGASAVCATAPARRPAALVAATGGGRVVTALMRVDSTPVASAASGFADAEKTRRQFRATMTVVQSAGVEYRLSAPALVFVSQRAGARVAPLQIGSTIRLRATLKPLMPEEGTAFLVFGTSPPGTVGDPPWWLSWANELRSSFSRASTSLPGEGGELLPGLSIGDVSAVSDGLDANMKASSLSHLTAVSGANCAVIIAVIMMLGAALGLRRGIRVGVALFTLAGFVVLVTPGASVLRAAVMAVIVVTSAAAGRPGRGVPALGAAVIVLLVLDPWMSRNYGFALSVLATAGLLVLAAPLAQRLSRWMPRMLAMAIAIPLAAQLACQPVLILLNPAIPLYGVAANMLAEPAAPIATVLGLVACLLLPWLPGVGFACAQIAWLPASWIAAVANVSVELPASQLPWLGGIAGVGVLTVLMVLLFIVVFRPPGRRGRRAVASATLLLIVFLGAYGGTLIGGGVGRVLAVPHDWQIAACDIGQGDAVLVQSGELHALIDVGPDPRPLASCLQTLGIRHIDLLVLTHYDLDHVGGLDAVIGMVGVALVGTPEGTQDQRKIDALVSGGADVRRASSGDHGTLGALRWDILWPQSGSQRMQTGNDGCVTIQFDGAGIRSLFLGDLGEDSQNALLATRRVRPVDVVKVAHHGSADQSEEMYRTLGARLGVISVGAHNSYGHPTDRLLGILARVGTRALRTDRQGMILIAPVPGRPGELTVWSQRQDAAPDVGSVVQTGTRASPQGNAVVGG